MDRLEQSPVGFVIMAMSRMHLELIGSQKLCSLKQMLVTILRQVRDKFWLNKMINSLLAMALLKFLYQLMTLM